MLTLLLLTMLDGSQIRFQVDKDTTLNLTTKYGKLAVSMADVSKCTIGAAIAKDNKRDRKFVGYPAKLLVGQDTLNGTLTDTHLSGQWALGKAEIPFGQIKEFVVITGKKTVKLRWEDGWKDVGIVVGPTTIVAKGEIDLWPQGPGQFVSRPIGLGGQTNGNYLPGAVIGRIDGREFLIGDAFSSMSMSGKLEMRIHPPSWGLPAGVTSIGEYEVEIEPN